MTPGIHSRRYWDGRMVWNSETFSHGDDTAFIQLKADEIDQINTAISSSKATGIPLGETGREHFDLAEFGQRLLALQEDLLEGRGFVVLRGLPDHWSDQDLIRAYWGIGSWFGDPVSQNARGRQQ